MILVYWPKIIIQNPWEPQSATYATQLCYSLQYSIDILKHVLGYNVSIILLCEGEVMRPCSQVIPILPREKKEVGEDTSGSRTSETGGQIFAELFSRPFLGVSRKNLCISPKNFIYLPKFLTTFFLVIDYFCVLICWFSIGGAKSVAHID